MSSREFCRRASGCAAVSPYGSGGQRLILPTQNLAEENFCIFLPDTQHTAKSARAISSIPPFDPLNDSTIIRYQPCLLDRLTDNEPQKRDESSLDRIISPRKYEAAIRRDLEWLLNSGSHPPVKNDVPCPLYEYERAASSVINFGFRQITGQSAIEVDALERRIYHAIRNYESRVDPNTLSVKAKLEGNAVYCEILADYWAEPVSLRQLIKTKVDLETGHAELLVGQTRC